MARTILKAALAGTTLIALVSCARPEQRDAGTPEHQAPAVAQTSPADTVGAPHSSDAPAEHTQRDPATVAPQHSAIETSGSAEAVSTPPPTLPTPATPPRLPRLVDLGAGKCIPCKMMAPVLEELKREYAGQFDVEFIDVWKDPEPGKTYGIKVIPTQIFLDASGKELFRHEGFFGKEDILKKWAELGVTVQPPKA